MAVTIAQIRALADSQHWQNRVSGAIFQKAVAILDDVFNNGTLENPKPGHTANFSQAQWTVARNICTGSTGTAVYFGPLAGSGNVAVQNITYSFEDRQVICDISDAALQSQVFTTVWQDIA